MTAVVVSCEHGGNRVPDPWKPLFRDAGGELASHRGWDPGSKEVACSFAESLEAPLHLHDVTRLLVDANRSVGHPRLFGERTRTLPRSQRDRILDQHYRPHRDAVEEAVVARISSEPVIHVSVHTFTPVLDGRRRTTGIGLLFDPTRDPERRIAEGWQQWLRTVLPELRIHRNQPYRGTSDGLTTALRRRFHPDRYSGIEVEVRSDLVHGPDGDPEGVGEVLADGLRRSLPGLR